jgi:hypothetical protein
MVENKTIIHSFERRRFENQAKFSPIPEKKRSFINKKRKMGGNVNNLEIKYSKKQIVHPSKWRKRLANLEVSL